MRRTMRPRRRDVLTFTAALPVLIRTQRAAGAHAPSSAATVEVDAREVSRRILRTRLSFPAAPGPFSLVYPKWLPGEHSPTGLINDVVGLAITAAGKPVPWERDPEDMYEFRCELPPGTRTVEVALDYVTAAGGRGARAPAIGSALLAVLKWNHALVYPKGADPRELMLTPSLRLPEGWSFATALEVDRKGRDEVRFVPVSLETLIDSPVAAGELTRSLDLTAPEGPVHTLELFADSREALAIKDEALAGYRHLVVEAGRLFGAWPYRRYRFLLSLSDQIPHGGLEHHESSDNRSWERTLLDDAPWVFRAGLLPHELVHAWNGKHRRPAGLATRDYQQPMHTELLWIYEGLTSYLGDVLTARAGLRSAGDARAAMAYAAALLDARPGRAWRPLADTAVAAPVLSSSVREWRSLRRGLDYYPESLLVWLEADVLIRQRTGGQRSLDDFGQRFCAKGAQGYPSVLPYALDDVLATLQEICPHDWAGFFRARVYTPTAHPPMEGLEQAGWRVVYRPEPTRYFACVEDATKEVDYTFSLGLVLKDDGTVLDVVEGRPAARAGMAPTGKVIAVNERRLTRPVLRAAVAATATRREIQLLVESDGYFRTHRLTWAGGNQFPALERDSRRPDLLSAILSPRGPGPQALRGPAEPRKSDDAAP